jgi:hypothetical protein
MESLACEKAGCLIELLPSKVKESALTNESILAMESLFAMTESGNATVSATLAVT